jgi:AcrR family transcriptional regulator
VYESATSEDGMQRSSREEVLDAVADSVRAVGVRRTTMAEIARRAGLSRSTLYTHFSDVREATAALLTRELVALLTRASDDGGDRLPARDRLVRRAVRLAATVPDDPLIERILELDGELLVPYLTHRLGSSQRAILDTVTDLVTTGQEDGSIREGDPALIAFSAFLVVQAFVISARIAEAEHGRDPVLLELETILHRTLAPAGIASLAPVIHPTERVPS